MDCNKEEAIRAKGIAEKKMQSKDFVAARKIAIKAQQLYPDLENISQMLMVCEVHCSAEHKLFGSEMDWYGILQIDQTANELTIKKQYRKFALQLHPDKNKFAGAEAAFKLIGEAQRVLLDRDKRSMHDLKRKASVRKTTVPYRPPQKASWNSNVGVQNNFRGNFSNINPQNQQQQQPFPPGYSDSRSTFWTVCPFCAVKYQYYREVLNRSLRCQSCNKPFIAYDTNVPGAPPPTNLRQQAFPQQKDGTNKSEVRFPGNAGADNSKAESFRKTGQKAGSSSGVHLVRVTRKRRGVIESSESSDSESSSESEEDMVIDDAVLQAGLKSGIYGEQQPRRSSRHKQQVSYKENLSDDDGIPPSKREKRSGSSCATEEEDEDASKEEASKMSNQSDCATGTKGDEERVKQKESACFEECLTKNVGETKKFEAKERVKVFDCEKNSEAHENSPLDKSSQEEQEADPFFSFPDSEFNDFEKIRKEECFEVGQVWAIYDTRNGMPRFYARIKKVHLPGFKVQITWLEPDPEDDNEMKWAEAGLPFSCGKFRQGHSETRKDHLMFSHTMSWEKIKSYYQIYPRKGETWAIFKNWSINWYSVLVIAILHVSYCSSFTLSLSLVPRSEVFSYLIPQTRSAMTVMTPAPIDQPEDEEMLVPHSDLPENNHQPMEVVAQPETANNVENQPVEDPPSSRFTWRIDNFSRMNTKKLYSDIFVVGGYKWRVLIFPKGNNVDHLSMYLDVADSASLPYGWSRYAQFCLGVVNQIHNKYSVRKDTQHQFNARESDWGFTSFMPLSDLYDPSRGYLVNDTLIIEAEVLVRRVVDYWTYDSKKETGYVGLKNQGATCYMNSLLQTLYHIPYFRKAVYHMPTTENDLPSQSIPLALQSLFYKLQYSDNSVATKELTKSFGWDTYDSFMQHDVQELNRVLCEKLEDKMKGTVVEGTIQKLFEGHHMNYIECINVDYKSTRKESFYDLQLDVKGCRDVYASFDKYVEVERLEGDNKYHAEQYGLQDAKKGVLFIDFPPVLQLQLKRFEYDFMRDTMVKINDRYEFPLQLDLDRENGKYLSPEADRSVRNLYTLHSVLVHSGGVHGGHYYAFIRPTLSDQWYKFEDERVTKEDIKRALEEQYGGEEELPQTNPGFNNTPFKFTKYSNAYMLVYVRESDRDKIICNVDEQDIAEHLRERLKKEQEEKEHKKKEKAEAHLYTIIKVARDENLVEQIGKDIYFDLVDHDKVRSFRIQKQTSFNVFKEEVAKEIGIPVQFLRFWLWAKRQNHTYRPNRPLTPVEETQSVGQLREVSNKVHNAELKLFLEVELGLDLHPIAPPEKTKDDILLFFKLYDPEKEELRYVGRLFVKSTGKAAEILSKLNEMAGYAPEEEIDLYEEIKFEPNVMCEPIDKKFTFRACQLEDGDIVCFQKPTPVENGEHLRYPDVPSFLDYVHNRQVVHFRSLGKPKEDDFSLELSKLHTYDDVVERVAQQLGLDDPSKIRLTSHNCYSQQPKPQPIKYRGVERLTDMLVHYNQTSDILYYEVLDIPLPELQGLKTLKVAFHHATKEEVVIHTIRLPKQSTVGDVINDLKTKVELSHPDAELRLLEVFYHKIYKVFPHSEKIENINDQYWTLRAEEVPDEEKNLGPNDRVIHVYHFTKDTAQNQMQIQNFGEPFFLVIHEGETLAEIKARVQKKLQVADEEFAKWKFAFLSLGRPEYLQDSDIVSSRFQRRDVYGAWEQYLGLEHSDSAPKRAYAANQNRHTFEKPVKIYN